MFDPARYLLFTWYDYDASGGWYDLEVVDNNLENVLQAAALAKADLYQVVDLKTFQVIYEGRPKNLLARYRKQAKP